MSDVAKNITILNPRGGPLSYNIIGKFKCRIIKIVEKEWHESQI